FDDKPGYSYLHRLFRDIFTHEGCQYGYVSDWSVQRDAQDEVACASPKAAGGRRKVVQEDEVTFSSSLASPFSLDSRYRLCIINHTKPPSRCVRCTFWSITVSS
ncbi:hypothetical protein BGY98DRAFT_924699, partial [Russula aff. rugulosa BPL654]